MIQQVPQNQSTALKTGSAASEKETGVVSASFSKAISAAPPISGAAPIQRAGMEEEEPLQGKLVTQLAKDQSETPSFASTIQRKGNQTGLPDNLRSGVENLSGYAMDDVKVHYNSAQPAGLQAHAYAQGTDIHVAPGQERHLPHEAWHIAQQKQGRVKPTMQMKRMNVNDDSSLELEADVMGAKAMEGGNVGSFGKTLQQKSLNNSTAPAQRILNKEDMISLTGPPGKRWGLYAKILNALDEIAKNAKPHKGIPLLYKLDRLVQEWLTKHGGENGQTFVGAKDNLRGRYLKSLPAEIEAEKNLLSEEAKGAMADNPSNVIRARKQRADAVKGTATANATAAGATAKSKFSVVAYVQHPDYAKFAKERMNMTLKNKMKPIGKKSTKDIKDAAAKKVVESKEAAKPEGERMSHRDKIDAIRSLGGAGVGHAFVEFEKVSPTGETLTKQSFGFAPAIPAPPKEATPGAVHSPDPHEKERTVKRMTFDIPQLKFDAGLTKAIGMMQTPPNYTLIGFNCTMFAKSIAEEIGVGFPQNAFLAVPFSGKIWNPNDMYDAIGEYG